MQSKNIINESSVMRLKSFVRRGKRTEAQKRAYEALWPVYGLKLSEGELNCSRLFGRESACVLEIGFGSGQSLLALAQSEVDKNFIAIETHRPGIGALLLGMQQSDITNIHLYEADAVDVLEKCIPDNSMDAIQLFFPDPWQKRRHHARRLIQPEFVKLLVQKLKTSGRLYLATDWEDYARHMMRVLSNEKNLQNAAGPGQFAERSPHRPILTKFERRAIKDGRVVCDLMFIKG